MIRHAIIIITLLLSALGASAQKAIHIYHDGKKEADVMLNYQIDSIYFTTVGKELHQVFATATEKKSYPAASIDSIKFQGEFLKIISPEKEIVVPAGTVQMLYKALSSEDYLIYDGFHGWYGYLGKFEAPEVIDGNFTTERIFHKIPLKSESGNLCDTIYITQLAYNERFVQEPGHMKFIVPNYCILTTLPGSQGWSNQNFESVIVLSPEKQSVDVAVHPLLDGILEVDPARLEEFAMDETDDRSVWISTARQDKNTLTINVEENKGGIRQCYLQIKSDHYITLNPYILVVQLSSGTHSAAEHRKALEDMYYSLGGKNWENQGNWLSDKPLYEWEWINNTPPGDAHGDVLLNSDRVLFLRFHHIEDLSSPIKGMLPESFTTIMDDALFIDLQNMGAIQGKVPEAITHHPKWNNIGWRFIQQHPATGADIDFDGINLQLPDSLVWDFVNNKKTSTKDILAKHKLTLMFNIFKTPDKNNISVGNLDEFAEDIINKYLDYAPKGLGLVFTTGHFPSVLESEKIELQEGIDQVRSMWQVPEDVDWTYTFSNATGVTHAEHGGDMALFDEKGNLVWFGVRTYLAQSDINRRVPVQYYIDRIDAACRKYLGDPVEHPLFALTHYTSTDFSQDGEVVQLQKATVGKGINVVFLGNGYVDRDMDSYYLDQMKEAMEQLFADDIMKKLRERFNVYTVKVVSLNRSAYEEGDHRIKNNEIAREYAKLIPGLDIDKAHICTINNLETSIVASGQTVMNPEGGSEIYIYDGGPSDIIAHEIAGHGIGKLLDEYVHSGFEDNKIPEDAVDDFRAWIKSEYHDWGWGMNLSAYEEPEKSPWAWMFEDPDYASEVSMFMGGSDWPYDVWRPTETSIMQDASRHYYNAPSREAIYQQVMQASEGDDWVYDREAFKAFDKAPVPASRAAAAPAVKASQPKTFIHRAPKILKKDANGRYISEPFDKGFFKSVPASRAGEAKQGGVSVYVTADGERHTVVTPME